MFLLLWRRDPGFGSAISDTVAGSSITIVLCENIPISHCNGCVKVALCRGCMRNTIVFLLGSALCKLCSTE